MVKLNELVDPGHRVAARLFLAEIVNTDGGKYVGPLLKLPVIRLWPPGLRSRDVLLVSRQLNLPLLSVQKQQERFPSQEDTLW